MSRHPAVFLAVILLLLMCAACTTVVGALTPEEAARQDSVNLSPEIPATFQVVGTRHWPGGVVVLWAFFKPASGQMPPPRMLAYSVVEQTSWGTWRATQSGVASGSAPPRSEHLVEFTRSGFSRLLDGPNPQSFSIVVGRVLAPNVAAVEVTGDGNQMIHDEVADGIFAVIVPTSTLCGLQVLDASGHVLQRMDMPGRSPADGRCPTAMP